MKEKYFWYSLLLLMTCWAIIKVLPLRGTDNDAILFYSLIISILTPATLIFTLAGVYELLNNFYSKFMKGNK